MRAVTLSNPRIVSLFSESAIPVWQSVRSVPKVTVDFGDGKKIQRTLGGNSVIYLCLPDGRVIDAYPGVYTPEDLMKELEPGLQLVRQLEPGREAKQVVEWHNKELGAIVTAERMRITLSKAFLESPLLQALDVRTPANLPDAGRPSVFERFASRLEDLSHRAESSKKIQETAAPDRPKTGMDVVRLDSRFSVTYLRTAVHLFFSESDSLRSPDEIRDIIYKKILHVPIDDPYLGLADIAIPGTGE